MADDGVGGHQPPKRVRIEGTASSSMGTSEVVDDVAPLESPVMFQYARIGRVECLSRELDQRPERIHEKL